MTQCCALEVEHSGVVEGVRHLENVAATGMLDDGRVVAFGGKAVDRDRRDPPPGPGEFGQHLVVETGERSRELVISQGSRHRHSIIAHARTLLARWSWRAVAQWTGGNVPSMVTM